MKLRAQQQRWDRLASTDPLGTVLGFRGEALSPWPTSEFFGTGRNDIAVARKILEPHGLWPRGGRALDFGCGVGRLTQPLCEDFDEVIGVDIAPAMIEQAERFNSHPGKCRYVVNAEDDLAQFETGRFDLVLSRIVLQHLSKRLAAGYLREFLRVLRPGGVLVVQIPSRRIRRRIRYRMSALFPRIFSALRRVTGRSPRIPMHVIAESEVRALVSGNGGTVVEVHPDAASGTDFESLVYYARRAT